MNSITTILYSILLGVGIVLVILPTILVGEVEMRKEKGLLIIAIGLALIIFGILGIVA